MSLVVPESHPLVGWDFNPPGDAVPTVTADQAIATANQTDGPPADSVQAILAIAPAGGTVAQDTLVWIVRYQGACVLRHGRDILDPTPGTTLGGVQCGRQFDEIIDATTGDEIIAYYDS